MSQRFAFVSYLNNVIRADVEVFVSLVCFMNKSNVVNVSV
jgi:hypothetical protein